MSNVHNDDKNVPQRNLRRDAVPDAMIEAPSGHERLERAQSPRESVLARATRLERDTLVQKLRRARQIVEAQAPRTTDAPSSIRQELRDGVIVLPRAARQQSRRDAMSVEDVEAIRERDRLAT